MLPDNDGLDLAAPKINAKRKFAFRLFIASK
jgi:hypothetical protein